MRLCPTQGGAGGTGGRSRRPWIRTSHEQGPRYKCNVGIYKKGGEKSPELGPFLGQGGVRGARGEEGAGNLSGLSSYDMTAATLSPSPSAFHPPLSTCHSGEAFCTCSWASAVRGRTLLATQVYWILLHPHPPCALDPNPADLSCLCSNDASWRCFAGDTSKHFTDIGRMGPPSLRERKEAKGSDLSQSR